MILFTNGCSWTWGGGLEPYFKSNHVSDHELRKSLVWPNYLGQLLGVSKTFNLSQGCGSNQRTVRTTFDWFLREYNSNEKVVAIIQITEPARYEYYVTDNIDDFENDRDYWARVTPTSLQSEHENYNTALNNKNQRLSTYTTIEGMYKLIGDCSALMHLFEKHNVEYYFFSGPFRLSEQYPVEYKNYLYSMPYLDIDHLWKYERISDADVHPSLLGHKQIAEYIYKAIRPSTGL